MNIINKLKAVSPAIQGLEEAADELKKYSAGLVKITPSNILAHSMEDRAYNEFVLDFFGGLSFRVDDIQFDNDCGTPVKLYISTGTCRGFTIVLNDHIQDNFNHLSIALARLKTIPEYLTTIHVSTNYNGDVMFGVAPTGRKQ